MYLSTRELAERLGIEEKMVRRLASFDKDPPKDRIKARKIGRLVKFHIKDVEAWESGRRSVRRRVRMGGGER